MVDKPKRYSRKNPGGSKRLGNKKHHIDARSRNRVSKRWSFEKPEVRPLKVYFLDLEGDKDKSV